MIARDLLRHLWGVQLSAVSVFGVFEAFREVSKRRSAPPKERRLAEIMAAHFDRAWLFARRLGVCDADLDDVMQEVTTIIYERLDSIREGSEKSFVFGTTFRVSSEHRRRRGRRKEAPEELAASVEDPGSLPDKEPEQREARAILDRILDEMPMDLRAVFVLYELDEREQTEIAELLSIPVGTVASRLRRAREDFDARVQRLQARMNNQTIQTAGRSS